MTYPDQKLFVIATMQKCERDDKGWFDPGASRLWGIIDTYEHAVELLHNNVTDLHEFLYRYAVIETKTFGITTGESEFTQWFEWDPDRKGFFEIPAPEATKGTCGFTF